jgi:serine/threonine protein kinase
MGHRMPTRPLDPRTDPTVAPDSLAGTVDAGSQPGPRPSGPVAAAPIGMRPGTVIADTYEITRLLGQGGMGAVWEAKHLRLPGKRVVVKVLLFGATDAVVLARFRREAEIGSRLGHPNIVQVLDFNTLADGTPYIVLELLQGESLASRLQRGPLSLEEVKSVVTQVGSALAAAHREGIVHRDLKPDNVFLCPTDLGGEVRDVVKVLDFGISKIRGSKTVLTQDAALIGTPQYMAPEQATGRNDEIDTRTDVFAFGAMTFEMIAGTPPFSGDTLASVIHAIVYSPTPSLAQAAKDVPPAVVAAIERALDKDRAARFPDVGSFVKAVTSRSLATAPGTETVTRPQPLVSPEPAAPTERISRKTKSSMMPVVAVIGVAVLGSVGFVVWKNNYANPDTEAEATASTPATTSTPTPTTKAEPPKVVASKEAEPQAEEPKAGEANAEEPKVVVKEPKTAKQPKEVKQAALAPEAAKDLEDAQAALDAGKHGEAIRLAQHSLFAQKTSRAHALITRARCAQGDLGNARAALAQVAARDRSSVVRACGKLGVDLK